MGDKDKLSLENHARLLKHNEWAFLVLDGEITELNPLHRAPNFELIFST